MLRGLKSDGRRCIYVYKVFVGGIRGHTGAHKIKKKRLKAIHLIGRSLMLGNVYITAMDATIGGLDFFTFVAGCKIVAAAAAAAAFFNSSTSPFFY